MHLNLKRIGVATTLYLLFATSPGFADAWMDVKLGAVDSGFSIATQFNFAKDDRVISLTSRLATPTLGERDYFELTAGYGRRFTYTYGVTTVQLGLGLIKLEQKDNQSSIEPTMPLMATFTLGKYLGFSGSAFIDFNRIKPIVGVEFGIALGKFR